MILAKFSSRHEDGTRFTREAYLPQVPAVGERVTFEPEGMLQGLAVMSVSWDLAEHEDPPLGGAPTVAYVGLEPIR